jgi:hypothetical protein
VKPIVIFATTFSILLAGVSSFGASEPTKGKASLAEDGGKLYYRWKDQYPSSRIKAYGAATDSPHMEICVPAQLWKKASRTQKLSIIYFVESIIEEIRNDPDPGGWLDVPGGKGGTAYEFQSKRLKQIRPEAWVISTALMKPKLYEVANCDEIELMGDDQWNADLRDSKQYEWKKPDPAKRASTFRK